MRIVYKVDNRPVRKALSEIKSGTVFSGEVDTVEGPWLRTQFGIVNLREAGRNRTGSAAHPVVAAVTNYREHEAELILY